MRHWVADQSEAGAETFFFIADLHSLTTEQDPELLRLRTLGLVNTLFAIGIDPARNTTFVQSHVHEHAELTWLIECTARFGELRRMTQFKDKGGESEGVRAGLFTYPCLMAADILLYDIDEVPVGEDQRQHLELARDVAIRFNSTYGHTFTVPKATIAKAGARIRDLQEPLRKMSKSEDSAGTVRLMEDPKSIERKIKRAVTDTDNEVRYDPTTKPGVSNLLEILASVTGGDPATLAGKYTQYGPLKTDTAEAVVEMVRPIQERFAELQRDPAATQEILREGASKARIVASATLARAQQNIGLLLPDAT